MPLTTASLILLSAMAAPPPSKMYKDDSSGFAFNYPREWTTRQKSARTIFEWKIEGKSVSVEVVNTIYQGTTEAWQTLQKQASEGANRTLDRQWQEDLLGVPLLLTQTTLGGTQSLTGLLYSATNRKFTFRLSSPTETMDAAVEQWRLALTSLRTLDGDLPKPESPDRVIPAEPPKPGKKPPKAELVDAPKPPRVVTLTPDLTRTPPRMPKGMQAFDTSAGGQTVTLFVPSGWSVSKDKDLFVLTHPKLKGNLSIEPLAELDSGKPEDSLLRATTETLDEFDKVDKRSDSAAHRSKVGAVMCRVERVGQSKGKARIDLYVTGDAESYYWLARYSCDDPKVYEQDKTVLHNLFDLMRLDLKK
ncbi:MAG: hypothetical protein JST40_07105 [Armatimonadetes bacterium]|nr:hypothetical protein [Armatimonadota bacterium]